MPSERLRELLATGIFERIEILPSPPPPTFSGAWAQRIFNAPSGSWEWRNPGYVKDMRSRISSAFDDWGGDLVWADGMGPVQFLSEKLPVAVDLCDSLALLFERQAITAGSRLDKFKIQREAAAYRRAERRVAKRFPVVTFVSDIDNEYFCRNRASGKMANTQTIPNGIDAEYFSEQSLSQEVPARSKTNVLFFGVLNYPPNTDAALFLAHEIFPAIRDAIPECELSLVGMDPPEEIRALNGKNAISVFGNVPDVRPYIANAALFICPLRFGAGMKNKILSAMAMSAPVIATSIAAEGLGIEPGEQAVVTNCAAEIAVEAIALLNDPVRSSALAARAKQHVQSSFSWSKSGALFEQALLKAKNAK